MAKETRTVDVATLTMDVVTADGVTVETVDGATVETVELAGRCRTRREERLGVFLTTSRTSRVRA